MIPPQKQTLTEMVNLRLTQDDYDALKKIADNQERSIPSVVRRIIREELRAEGGS